MLFVHFHSTRTQTCLLFQEDLSYPSMINNLELPIRKIIYRNLVPYLWNLCIIRHISCIYSLGFQVVKLWNFFHTCLLVSKKLMRFPTCLSNIILKTFNTQLTYEICVILNRELGNLSSHSFKDGDNFKPNTHSKSWKQKNLISLQIIFYLILGIEFNFKVHVPLKTWSHKLSRYRNSWSKRVS